MIQIDNAEIMVNQIFLHEPNALLNILEGNETIAIIYKEDWESEGFAHIKVKCRRYRANDFFERVDIPIIGTVIKIKLEKLIEPQAESEG